MKKVLLTLALVATASLSNAQVLRNNFLNGCKEGEPIEKAAYTAKKAPLNKDVWSAVFNEKAPYIGESPVAGKELSYKGYNEKGLSIIWGGLPEDATFRPSIYGLESGRAYSTGTYYVSFLVNFSKFKAKGNMDFISTSTNHAAGTSRGFVFASNQGSKLKFGVGIHKQRASSPKTYDLNATHLIVLKIDFAQNQASLFVDPELKDKEPTPDAVATEEGALKAGIKGIMLKNRNNYAGNIGNFRFTDSWAGIIGK
ncbi:MULTISPECIES: hypothetical protein [Bacteroides]|uniref:DUF1080 domain-containing protein n=1 Tax=Bacteroides zhangwenhongii TaxID=2650157 RepID=A0ABT5H9U3_9BACE|nr:MULTISPECIES: hypothetical protein [Bacteroides]MDC7137294.1 hypothetical protein [Bacteroides zhangwenhongii]